MIWFKVDGNAICNCKCRKVEVPKVPVNPEDEEAILAYFSNLRKQENDGITDS